MLGLRMGGRPRSSSIFTRRTRAARRRRVLVLTVVVVGAASIAWRLETSGGGDAAARPAPANLTLKAGNGVLARIPSARYLRAGRPSLELLAAAVRLALPAKSRAVTGLTATTYSYDAAATTRRAARLGRRGGTVAVVRSEVSTVIQAPARRQQQANTCESAALSILLATRSRSISERRLQRALPRSGPADPREEGAIRVWGDPDRGYVGRADGGGVAGGFGVYPGPVVTAAARFGVRLRDLTGRSPGAVYSALRAGRAVMAWVGLSAGPYGTWTSPQGKAIAVNFGEHTVVLHGIRADGSVLVSNPLRGTRETWTPSKFERMWDLLGRRAVTT